MSGITWKTLAFDQSGYDAKRRANQQLTDSVNQFMNVGSNYMNQLAQRDIQNRNAITDANTSDIVNRIYAQNNHNDLTNSIDAGNYSVDNLQNYYGKGQFNLDAVNKALVQRKDQLRSQSIDDQNRLINNTEKVSNYQANLVKHSQNLSNAKQKYLSSLKKYFGGATYTQAQLAKFNNSHPDAIALKDATNQYNIVQDQLNNITNAIYGNNVPDNIGNTSSLYTDSSNTPTEGSNNNININNIDAIRQIMETTDIDNQKDQNVNESIENRIVNSSNNTNKDNNTNNNKSSENIEKPSAEDIKEINANDISINSTGAEKYRKQMAQQNIKKTALKVTNASKNDKYAESNQQIVNAIENFTKTGNISDFKKAIPNNLLGEKFMQTFERDGGAKISNINKVASNITESVKQNVIENIIGSISVGENVLKDNQLLTTYLQHKKENKYTTATGSKVSAIDVGNIKNDINKLGNDPSSKDLKALTKKVIGANVDDDNGNWFKMDHGDDIGRLIVDMYHNSPENFDPSLISSIYKDIYDHSTEKVASKPGHVKTNYIYDDDISTFEKRLKVLASLNDKDWAELKIASEHYNNVNQYLDSPTYRARLLEDVHKTYDDDPTGESILHRAIYKLESDFKNSNLNVMQENKDITRMFNQEKHQKIFNAFNDKVNNYRSAVAKLQTAVTGATMQDIDPDITTINDYSKAIDNAKKELTDYLSNYKLPKDIAKYIGTSNYDDNDSIIKWKKLLKSALDITGKKAYKIGD